MVFFLEEVDAQEKRLYEIGKEFGGIPAGEENGRYGYRLTFAIAYLRVLVLILAIFFSFYFKASLLTELDRVIVVNCCQQFCDSVPLLLRFLNVECNIVLTLTEQLPFVTKGKTADFEAVLVFHILNLL